MNVGAGEKKTGDFLEILYQDNDLVAVNKPSGLLVHRSPVDRREKKAAVQMLRNQIGRHVYPVHRLDRPTSGVLLFALSPEIARTVSDQFQSRNVTKKYVAVVRGYIPESGAIDHPVKEVKDRYIPFQDQETPNTHSARTVYKRLATIELPVDVDKYPTTRYSLVELIPLTGRRHQLRYHMKHLGHPIIGDTRYGQTVHNRFFRNQFQCNQLLLCARVLTISHPKNGEKIRIESSLSPAFQQVVSCFQWDQMVFLG